MIEEEDPARQRMTPLAIFQNGEAVRAGEVRAIRITPEESEFAQGRRLYAVRVVLESGDVIEIARRLTQPEAERLGNGAAKAVNSALSVARG